MFYGEYWAVVGLIVYLATPILAALCLFVILRSVLPPRGFHRAAHCGACGHELTVLEAGRCPECGALLTRCGVLTPAALVRYRGSMIELVLAWSMLFAIVGTPTAGLIHSIAAPSLVTGMSGQSTTYRYTLKQAFRPQDSWDADAGRYTASAEYRLQFDVDVVLENWQNPTEGTVVVVLERNGEDRATLEADIEQGTVIITDAADQVVYEGSSNDPHAPGDDLYTAAGFDLQSSQDLRYEAADLGTLLNKAFFQPHTLTQSSTLLLVPSGNATFNTGAVVGTNNTTYQRESFVSMVIWITYWSVYLLGLVLLIWWRGRTLRRMLRDPKKPPSAQPEQPAAVATG